MNDAVDPELKVIHQEILGLYNRETTAIKARPTSVLSINVNNFLAGEATRFADAALILMEDARQPLNVPAALLRTCLEAQARANHIIALKGQQREDRAGELEQLMKLGQEYYMTLTIKLYQSVSQDESKFKPRDRPYLGLLNSAFGKADTSKLKGLEKKYKELNRNWGYTKVIERDRFADPNAMSRSEAQPLQPGLHLLYTKCCAFVHSDPAGIAHAQILSRIGISYNLVLAETIAVMCFFTSLGKEDDRDLLSLKKGIIAFDANEKILPKKDLPSV